MATKVQQVESSDQYSSQATGLIKSLVSDFNMPAVLKNGLLAKPYVGWNYQEQQICLLYAHLLLIRLNDMAHRHASGLILEPVHVQLMDRINDDPELQAIFGHLTVTVD